MKRLYRVTVETTLYVLAENAREAEHAADSIHDEVDTKQIHATEPDSILTIIGDKWRNERPYDADDVCAGYEEGDPTCEELFVMRFGECSVQGCGNYRPSEDQKVCNGHAQTKEMF